MFISVLELFKIGIGPSSSHTMGPMVAANDFLCRSCEHLKAQTTDIQASIRCVLKGSLAFTGKGHGTDRAVILGLHGYLPEQLSGTDINGLDKKLSKSVSLQCAEKLEIAFDAEKDIVFDQGEPLAEHPNGMIFELIDENNKSLLTETYFSIGGGFINTLDEIKQLVAPMKTISSNQCAYPFASADSMLDMSIKNTVSIADMKRSNEQELQSQQSLNQGLDAIWNAMKACVENGLSAQGALPGGLKIERRANGLYQQLTEHTDTANVNDWLCAYAMAVNEENAAGNMVVTAPTNGAAGVIPAVLYYAVKHENANQQQVFNFLLTAAAIGGIIKHNSSISGAEVGCQGEVGSAAAMAAAGLCEIRDGTTEQIENAAEIALEHHLGMTCDPVNGLVQVPCIERNAFGAIKAYTAASLALRGSGQHFMSLDNCISAMKQTGLEMSHKYKETSLGGLAVSITEC